MHDSSERDPPPKCHPGTRTGVVDDLLAKITSPHAPFPIIWLYGPFGNGKSAIIQTTIEHLQGSNPDLFAGAFFFGKGKPGRDQAVHLIPTIAFQIAVNFPHFRPLIDKAMLANPGICSKSIKIQLQRLLVEPIQKSKNTFSQAVCIFIDGLDECEGVQAQRAILQAIQEALATQDLPLRFVVASRPEGHLQDVLNPAGGQEMCDRVSLIDYRDVDADVECYLRDGFSQIATTHSVMKNQYESWPDRHDIDTLIRRTSGQFLFAEIVLSFVGSEWEHPVEQLNSVLQLDQSTDGSSIFSNMDMIYRMILEKCPKRQEMLRLLRCMVSRGEDFFGGLTTLAIMAQVRSFEAKQIMRNLAALVCLSPTRDEVLDETIYPFLSDRINVSLFHVSFQEFLESSGRSKEFHVGADRKNFTLIMDSYVAEALLGRYVSLLLQYRGNIHMIPRSKTSYRSSFWWSVIRRLSCETRGFPGLLEMWPKLSGIILDPAFRSDFVPVQQCSRIQLVCALATVSSGIRYSLWVKCINRFARPWLYADWDVLKDSNQRKAKQVYEYCRMRLEYLLPRTIDKMTDRICALIECRAIIGNNPHKAWGEALRGLYLNLSPSEIDVLHQIFFHSGDSGAHFGLYSSIETTFQCGSSTFFFQYRACQLRALAAKLEAFIPPYKFPYWMYVKRDRKVSFRWCLTLASSTRTTSLG